VARLRTIIAQSCYWLLFSWVFQGHAPEIFSTLKVQRDHSLKFQSEILAQRTEFCSWKRVSKLKILFPLYYISLLSFSTFYRFGTLSYVKSPDFRYRPETDKT
jgi:hypothetical protein